MKLTYDPKCPSAGWLVGRSVGQSVIISSLPSHAPFQALIFQLLMKEVKPVFTVLELVCPVHEEGVDLHVLKVFSLTIKINRMAKSFEGPDLISTTHGTKQVPFSIIFGMLKETVYIYLLSTVSLKVR